MHVNRVSCRLAAQLPDEGRHQLTGLSDEPLINLALRPLQCEKVIRLSRAAEPEPAAAAEAAAAVAAAAREAVVAAAGVAEAEGRRSPGT